MKCDFQTFLLASVLDKMSILVWMQSDDAVKGVNRPKQVANLLLEGYEGQHSDVTAYASGKDFDEARNEILRQIENGN